MIRRLTVAIVLASFAGIAAQAGTKTFAASGFALPADKPVTVVLLRPDVEVGEMQAGGVNQPNADWTNAARSNIQKALEANQAARHTQLTVLSDQDGAAAQTVSDYEALHQAIAAAILTHKYFHGASLPTKKDRFDWTMGPGTQRLADISGSNYGLFLFVRDSFTSAARRGVQAVGMLGCLVGVCVIATGGQHSYYASLVDLSTGNIVWFDVLQGDRGDVREPQGAATMIDALLQSMPTKAGEAAPAKTK